MKAYVRIEGWEILTLHKLILDCKFQLDRWDELFESELIAEIAHRLINGLIDLDAELKDIESRKYWESFLDVSELNDTRTQLILEHLKEPKTAEYWSSATREQKTHCLSVLFSPYLPTRELLDELTVLHMSSDSTI